MRSSSCISQTGGAYRWRWHDSPLTQRRHRYRPTSDASPIALQTHARQQHTRFISHLISARNNSNKQRLTCDDSDSRPVRRGVDVLLVVDDDDDDESNGTPSLLSPFMSTARAEQTNTNTYHSATLDRNHNTSKQAQQQQPGPRCGDDATDDVSDDERRVSSNATTQHTLRAFSHSPRRNTTTRTERGRGQASAAARTTAAALTAIEHHRRWLCWLVCLVGSSRCAETTRTMRNLFRRTS